VKLTTITHELALNVCIGNSVCIDTNLHVPSPDPDIIKLLQGENSTARTASSCPSIDVEHLVAG